MDNRNVLHRVLLRTKRTPSVLIESRGRMHPQQVLQHCSCYSRGQTTVPPTKRPRLLEAPLVVRTQPLTSRRVCTAAQSRVTVHCSGNYDRPQIESGQSPSSGAQPANTQSNSALLAVGSIGLAVFAFVASRSLTGRPALEELRIQSMPLDSALSNGRPTVLEFYADWCEVCNELAPTTLEVSSSSPHAE